VRLRIDLAYEGTNFHGWAIQPSLRTVQGTFESALATVLRVQRVSVTCAGRTDTGVHARAQVVHLDVDEAVLVAVDGRDPASATGALLRRLNGILPQEVRVQRVCQAPAGFDARFSALWRRYAYRIADRAEALDPLMRRTVLTRSRPLDIDAMNVAADVLLGEHDFAAFCKKRAGATTIRTLIELSWARSETGLAVATVRADAFCHNMVRSLVGCLIPVGEGRGSPEWAAEVLGRGVRDPRVSVLPGRGLTLEQIAYPRDADLATQAEAARVVRTLSHRGGDVGG
jgi:tRNA pseudouridine38-40 synthase